MEQVGGILIVIGAGCLNGSFSVPMKWILENNHLTHWKYEHCWFLYTISALVILPWSFALIFVGPDELFDSYQDLSFTEWFLPMICGFGWGLGSATLGIGIDMIGLSLSTAIVLGITSSFGSLGSLILFRPDDIISYEGLLTTLGVIVTVLGLTLVSYAGHLKDSQEGSLRLEKLKNKLPGNVLYETGEDSQSSSELNSSDEHTHGFESTFQEQSNFTYGLIICIMSGVLSSFQNFGFQLSDNLTDDLKDRGKSELEAMFAVLCLVISSLGALGNGAPALWKLFKSNEWNLFFFGDLTTDIEIRNSTASSTYHSRVLNSLIKHYALCLLGMGGLWFAAVLFYGLGAQLLDNFAVSWALFMCTTILTANTWSVGFGEWSNTTNEITKFIVSGLLVLTLAVILLASAVAV